MSYASCACTCGGCPHTSHVPAGWAPFTVCLILGLLLCMQRITSSVLPAAYWQQQTTNNKLFWLAVGAACFYATYSPTLHAKALISFQFLLRAWTPPLLDLTAPALTPPRMCPLVGYASTGSHLHQVHLRGLERKVGLVYIAAPQPSHERLQRAQPQGEG